MSTKNRAVTKNPPSYHHRRKAEHQAWLRGLKRRCARCSEHRAHRLTVLDKETGRGLGMSVGGWSTPKSRRDAIAERAIVLCFKHGYEYRRELRDLPRES